MHSFLLFTIVCFKTSPLWSLDDRNLTQQQVSNVVSNSEAICTIQLLHRIGGKPQKQYEYYDLLVNKVIK